MTNPPPAAESAAESAPQQRSLPIRFALSCFALASLGSVALWLAQPPVAWGWLAWGATAPWLAIASRRLPLRRGAYVQLWLAGGLYWLLAVHWVRLPHPLTPIGWVCLAGYLGCYLPTFVWLTRAAISRTPAPLWLAAPIVWTGLEFLQAHLFSGFLMGALSHTQAFYPLVIQIADAVGAYGVSFAIMLTTAAIVTWVDKLIATAFKQPASESTISGPALAARNQQRALGAAVAAGCLMLMIAYGRVAVSESADASPKITAALIQGNTLAVWNADPVARNQQIMDRQVAISQQAVEQAAAEGKRIDLFVWPESMFRPPVLTFEGSNERSPKAAEDLTLTQDLTQTWFRQLSAGLGAPLLMGADRFDLRGSNADAPSDVYNSSVFINAEGQLAASYDKVHRVPFGEYIPLAKNLPALYFMTPMEGGLRPGAGPVAMELRIKNRESKGEESNAPRSSLFLSPNICYETVIPHVIHGQVRELTDAGTPPDLLVNLTNDAWFWGSSELDMHLACDIFRSVETRTPMIIAANGGLSGVIDDRGRVLALSERQTEQALVADAPLRRPGPPSPYVRHGDWFAGGCLIVCVLVGIIGLLKGERRKGNAE